MDGPFGDQYKLNCKNKSEWKWTDDFFLPWFEPCFITRHEKPYKNIYHRPLLHEDTNNGQYSEISILLTVLQLSGRPVAKCNQWNDRATQILPNTGPTGNPIISFAKVTVKSMSSQTMQTCWLSNYAYVFQYLYVRPPKICVEHPTYTINWVVRWVIQDSSLAAALILVIFNWFHGLSRSLIDGRPRTDADHQTTTMGSPMDDSGFWHFLQHWSGDP